MLEAQIQIRTRYAETDQMGYVYYGHYLTYLEIGRTEAIRQVGITYQALETEHNIMLPVAEAHLEYKRPIRYDQLITIQTAVHSLPNSARIRFDSQILDDQQLLLAEGYVVLVFIDAQTRRPCRPPQFFLDAMAPFFQTPAL
jgi:acyl-CoA thioester hydrolase